MPTLSLTKKELAALKWLVESSELGREMELMAESDRYTLLSLIKKINDLWFETLPKKLKV